MPYQNISTGRRVAVRGKEGVVREEGDQCKVKFDDGSFGFFDRNEITPVDVVSWQKMKAEGKVEDIMMPPTATGEDPLSQPKRKTGRGVGEDQTVLGKAVSGDIFVKSTSASSDDEYSIRSRKFRNRKTGEVVTQVPILDIADYDEVEEKEAGMKCPECGKKLTNEDAYGHDCEVGVGKKDAGDMDTKVGQIVKSDLE